MSEGHGFLYLLSRLITKGYIPQLSDHTWSGAKDQTFYKKIWSGMTYYLWDGGPLTNNKDSKNPLVGAWHNGLQEKVAAFTLVHVQDEKSMITAAFSCSPLCHAPTRGFLESLLFVSGPPSQR
jgi:hypothetical protein